MQIEIPDDLLNKPEYGASELIVDIAVLLYQRKQISLGKAAGLAKRNRIEFQRILAERGISIDYDLELDLKTLREAGITL